MSQVEHSLNSVAHFLPNQFHIGINISPAHFLSPGLEDSCMKFLSTFPKGKVKLVLELTERNKLSVTPNQKRYLRNYINREYCLHWMILVLAMQPTATCSRFLSITSNSMKGFVQMVGVGENLRAYSRKCY